ncbi:MAG: hypothetical protein ACLF0P_14060 [Thermoanaerobaculia bacterium]
MSEPTGPPREPSAPSPFDDAREVRPGGSGGPGVRKPLLIGCGVLLLLALVAFAVFVAYQDSIAAWVFEAMETELEPMLPEDLPPEVRDRYTSAFAAAEEAARAGEYRPEDLQRVQGEFTRILQDGGARMSREEVERLAAALEEFAAGGEGGEAPASDTTRAPEPEP